MTVRPVTPLVQPHGLVIIDADAEGYDRWRDELAVPDPYATEWEPVTRHGLITEPEDVPAPSSRAGTPGQHTSPAGRPANAATSADGTGVAARGPLQD